MRPSVAEQAVRPFKAMNLYQYIAQRSKRRTDPILSQIARSPFFSRWTQYPLKSPDISVSIQVNYLGGSQCDRTSRKTSGQRPSAGAQGPLKSVLITTQYQQSRRRSKGPFRSPTSSTHNDLRKKFKTTIYGMIEIINSLSYYILWFRYYYTDSPTLVTKD